LSACAVRMPMRLIRSCAARAASGQLTAAPPSSVMKSRRFVGCPLLRLSAGHYHTVAEERRCASQQKLRDDVADGSILLKKAPLISTYRDSVFLKLSATGDGRSPDGRSEPAVLPFQPRRTDSSGSSPTPAQSNRHAGAGRSSREARAVLQRHRAALDRS